VTVRVLLDTHTLLWWLDGDVAGCLARQRFESLDITVLHAQRAGRLPGTHRDPFDRMLIAQAQIEDLPIVTNDEVFDGYGVTRLW
jgi:PIN domain nuclease of toxin-antitoxin system